MTNSAPRHRSHLDTRLTALALLLVLVACETKPKAPPKVPAWFVNQPGQILWQRLEKKSDRVLARVNGVAITRHQLDRAKKDYPDVAEDILFNRLIEFELLAQEALKRGYLRDFAVQNAGRRMAVRLLLKEKLEVETTPKYIPMGYVRMAYHRQRRRFYVHPDGFSMVALTIHCCKQRSREETEKFAWYVYESHGDRLVTEGDFAALVNFARLSPFKLNYHLINAWYDFDLADQSKATYQRYTKSFTETFIRMKPGELSKPFRSEFGYHLIRLWNRFPKENKSLSQVEPRVRRSIFPAYQRIARDVYFRDLKAYYPTKLHPEKLGAFADR